MPLVQHLHFHLHVADNGEKLTKIMALLEDFKKVQAEQKASIENIAGDIARLKADLAKMLEEKGLSKSEAEAALADLQLQSDKLKQLADSTPEPEIEEPV
ncbi:MAG: hypothetical protein ACRCT6_09215 [Notoacmeibacter sp.]